MAAAASSNSELATHARSKMNSFFKKILVAGFLLQAAFWGFSAPTGMNLDILPLWFEANHGQVDSPSQFVAHGRDLECLISPAEAEIVLRTTGGKTASTRMQFVGANPSAEISGGLDMGGKINYLIGNDPAHWQSGVPTFGQVRVDQVYPGINVVYYGNQQHLEYDFDLAPGANPETITLRFAGADRVSVSPGGDLVVRLAGRDIVQHRPVAYQTSGGVREPVQAGYKILDAHTVAFSVGHYDARLPLVIDPVLAFSTYFGGNNFTIVWGVAYGTNDDSVYITGSTLASQVTSTRPFATPGAFQTNYAGGKNESDAFVAKFDSSGTNLIYCTYLGGSADDAAYALAVGPEGNAFVTGATYSTNFPIKNPIAYTNPVTGQKFDGSKYGGVYNNVYYTYPSDIFVTELGATGTNLVYSTFLGGNSWNVGFGLALDSAGDAFITGETYSTNFPVTPGNYQTNFASVNNSVGFNAFVSEIGYNGTGAATLNYSSYLGGTNQDTGYAISFNNGYLAVAGATCSSNFPTVNWIGYDNSGGSNFYTGNVLNSNSNNINNALEIGATTCDAFVALFQTNGATLTQPLYSTFLGGTNSDIAYGVAVNSAGTVYVAGSTTSTNFPNTFNTNQAVLSSYLRTNTVGVQFTNAFLTVITWNPSSTNVYGGYPAIGYSQIFGSIGDDYAHAVTLDAAGDVFVVGATTALTNYNASISNVVGSLTYTNSGGNDVMVTAFKSDLSGLLYSVDFGGSSDDLGWAVAVDPDGNAYIGGQTYLYNGAPIGFPVFNAWLAAPQTGAGSYSGFLTKIWLTPPVLPVLTVSNLSTNLLVTWSSVSSAQINTNSFYLETTTNLYSTVITTNVTIITNTVPATTNIVISTNTMAPANWTPVTRNPFSTNQITGDVTNQIYTYQFNPTNRMLFFRLQGY
jgi:hypothetical protein